MWLLIPAGIKAKSELEPGLSNVTETEAFYGNWIKFQTKYSGT